MTSKTENREFILECIKVYKSLPSLWDTKCKDYNNRRKKDEAYAELLKKYSEKYPGATREDITKKINSLRTNFRKELRRIQTTISEKEITVKPTLWYFDAMSFLVQNEDFMNSTVANDSIKIEDLEEHDCLVNTENNNQADKDMKQVNKKKRKVELLGSTCKCQNECEYDKIAKAWAVELQKISPEQQIYAKKAINEILYEAQLGNLNRYSLQINNTSKY